MFTSPFGYAFINASISCVVGFAVKMENQKIDQKVHQAIVQEIIEQRDKAMSEAIQKGADLRLAVAQIKELQEKLEKKDQEIENYISDVIKADIIVSKSNHKKIIIGKKGEMIKNIGIKARELIELYLNKKIHLSLFVVVKDNWKNNSTILKDIGYIE